MLKFLNRFIWIMGTAMAYSFTGMLRRVTPKHKIFWKIFKRSCILFVLGLLVNTGGCDRELIYATFTLHLLLTVTLFACFCDSHCLYWLRLSVLLLTATRLTHLRIPGVLQRFAGTYLVVASIHMFFAKTVDVSMVRQYKFIDIVGYILDICNWHLWL